MLLTRTSYISVVVEVHTCTSECESTKVIEANFFFNPAPSLALYYAGLLHQSRLLNYDKLRSQRRNFLP